MRNKDKMHPRLWDNHQQNSLTSTFACLLCTVLYSLYVFYMHARNITMYIMLPVLTCNIIFL